MPRLLLCLLTLLATTGRAQTAVTTVVADADTHEGIAHASLYTKEGGRFRSVVSNSRGAATVAFTFRRLTISHLNYERLTVSQLGDTVFLKPKYRSTAEVVVINKEPEWIRRCLKETVNRKAQNYFTHDGCERLDYHTQSTGRDNIYRFHLNGLLRTKTADRKRYALHCDSTDAHIVASDSTRLTDTQNLRRMLYEDFMEDLSRDFIRSHRFYHYADYKGANSHEVKLSFKAKHHTDDRGWMILDTVRYVVRSAYRSTGTKTNRRERIGTMMYNVARVFGYRVDTFTRDYRVSYGERPDGTLYPAEVRYKMYYAGRDGDATKEEAEFSQQTGGGFPNMEATLTLTPPTPILNSPLGPKGRFAFEEFSILNWTELPPSWYVTFNSEADRQLEVQLSNLPATFSIFDEQP